FLRNQRGPRAARAPLPAALSCEDPSVQDREWLVGWRRCLLRRAWRALAKHQQRSPGNLCHSVLSALARHPREDCEALATRGRPGRYAGGGRTAAQGPVGHAARENGCPATSAHSVSVTHRPSPCILGGGESTCRPGEGRARPCELRGSLPPDVLSPGGGAGG